MNENHEFLTLLKSPHDHYYGLTRKEVENVLSYHKIPIFKLTLSAFIEMIHKKKLDCHAVYVRVKNLKDLENRLKYGPFSKEEIEEKIWNAKLE